MQRDNLGEILILIVALQTNILQDARIVLVEDEMLICPDIEDMLQEFGCKVVCPAATVSKALAHIGYITR